tara:strand:+ start:1243 stop:1416 length:174 start_codon:yes stop_codon:yes gene_type:complete
MDTYRSKPPKTKQKKDKATKPDKEYKKPRSRSFQKLNKKEQDTSTEASKRFLKKKGK